MTRLLAVASAGGHWIQLLRMRPAFQGMDVSFVSTREGLGDQISSGAYFRVRDSSMWDKFGLAITAIQVLILIFRVRPHVVVTTGAAPGYFAIVFGHILGAKTIWIDSMANSEELSLAGKRAGRFADHWLTQWSHLEQDDGPHYIGSVL